MTGFLYALYLPWLDLAAAVVVAPMAYLMAKVCPIGRPRYCAGAVIAMCVSEALIRPATVIAEAGRADIGTVLGSIGALAELAAVGYAVAEPLHRRAQHGSPLLDRTALSELDSSGFERFIAALLQRSGWTAVRCVGGPHDQGVDILATDPFGRATAVQCKWYAPSTRVTAPMVRDAIGGQLLRSADRLLVVTTSSYTADALKIPHTLPWVELWDGARLTREQREARALADDDAEFADRPRSRAWRSYRRAVGRLADRVAAMN